jgi:hypothetical protein
MIARKLIRRVMRVHIHCIVHVHRTHIGVLQYTHVVADFRHLHAIAHIVAVMLVRTLTTSFSATLSS